MKINMFCKAKFIGTDGSLGYHKNQIYDLHLLELGWWSAFWRGWKVEIHTKLGFCPYKDTWAFFANWRIVERIQGEIQQ